VPRHCPFRSHIGNVTMPLSAAHAMLPPLLQVQVPHCHAPPGYTCYVTMPLSVVLATLPALFTATQAISLHHVPAPLTSVHATSLHPSQLHGQRISHPRPQAQAISPYPWAACMAQPIMMPILVLIPMPHHTNSLQCMPCRRPLPAVWATLLHTL
jgi:hypothetical protein